ncbi:outer membrane beta-barrel protein [Sphingomonas sp. DG1-23]|uniref:outer membrane protein n=1 Tax=Sphingomonas sp. DG1-23 TaxID=3068316 RepID=UPI0027402DC7|nr:outer membrane beta-barrel protein [Sphingomonas sp. DG1-23]MDP5280868.1 outer membrane beta-barrel protein [Sphingomonas sp. DG1-23]
MKKLLAVAFAALCVPGIAAAQDEQNEVTHKFSGARVEARIGYETPTVTVDGDDDVYKIGSAVSYGGEIGFDIRADKVVLGPYVNYEFSGVDLCDGGTCLGEKGNLSVGARIGAIVGSKGLIYGKIGYASIEIEAEAEGESGSESKGGVQGSLGFEFGFGRNAYGFLEGSYADYGDFYGLNLQRRQVVGGVGFRF